MSMTQDLAVLLPRIMERKRGLRLRRTRFIVDSNGLAIGPDALRDRFDRAREKAGAPKETFQFRDLRANAGMDKAESSSDIQQAQTRLGHASVVMTEHWVRKRKGSKITPTR